METQLLMILAILIMILMLIFYYKSKDKKTKGEVKDVYFKGKKAFETKLIDVPTAEASAKLTTAAAEVIKSLEKTDEAVLKFGALLVVKIQKEGKTLIMAETVSPAISSILDNNPNILKFPNALYELMIGDKKQPEKLHDGEMTTVS
jgi:hypothetical protein